MVFKVGSHHMLNYILKASEIIRAWNFSPPPFFNMRRLRMRY